MMQDQERRAQIVAFIHENTRTAPWPQLEVVLKERGYTAEEIAAALDEVFPGQNGRRKKSGLWSGLVGALVGIVVWIVLAILYRLTH